jgi:glycosyl transferase family 2/methyltransferase family protein
MTHPPASRLALFSMVKNEQDIIEDFLDQALTLFDVTYLLDHQSRDGTWELCESVASQTPQLQLFRLDAESYPQSEVATWFCREIFAREQPDWIFFLDCDEFLPFNDPGDFRGALATGDADLVEMVWQNIGPADRAGWQGIRHTPFVQVRRPSLYKKTAVRRSAWEKAGHDLIIEQGYHSAYARNGSALDKADTAFTLLHVPLRSVEQVQQKLIVGKLAYWRDARHQGPNGIGAHWSDMLENCLASPAAWLASLRTQLLNYGLPRRAWVSADEASFGPLEHHFNYRHAFEPELGADRARVTPSLLVWLEVERFLRDGGSASESSDSTSGAYRVTDRRGHLLIERAALRDRSNSGPIREPEPRSSDLELIRQFVCWMNTPPRAITSTDRIHHLGVINAMVGLGRPRSVVVLGVSGGDAFCALCDACQAHELTADVVGIVWRENQTANATTDGTLAARISRDYSFARLIRHNAQSARQQLSDGTIDFLYIDGGHRPRADQSLKDWATALSDCCIVVYDRRERPDDGHVEVPPWADWALPHPSQMVEVSDGLQILFVGTQSPPVRQFVAIWQRSIYFRELLRMSALLMASTFGARLAALNVEEATAPLHRTIADLTDQLTAAERDRAERERDREKERQIHAVERGQQATERNRLDEEVRRLADVVKAMQTSTSWRITAPLRRVAITGRRLMQRRS